MLDGLRHHRIIRCHHQHGDIDPRRSCKHVPDKSLVAGDIYDPQLV